MAIECRCSSCEANLIIAEKYAGRKVKCPKCDGPIAVPEADAPKDLPAAKPISPPPRRPPIAASDAPPAETVEVIADQGPPNADSSGGGFPGIVLDPQAPSPRSRVSGRKTRASAGEGGKSKAGKPAWLAPSTISAAALALVVVGVLVFRFGGGWLSSEDRERSVLAIDWPASQRNGAAVYIDGNKQELPRSGPVEFRLKPGRHRVVMLRRGYDQVETTLALKTGRRHRFKPRWSQSEVIEFVPPDWSNQPGGGWLQDMEAAKQRAAGENKDILLVFEGSDWDKRSIEMREEVFSQREFHEQVDWRYVLVSVDFPKESEAQGRVEDPQRNKRLAEDFHISEYPRVVLTDAEGRPYSVEGYAGGDVEAFVDRLAQWQSVRERRDTCFLNVEMAQGDEKLEAVEEAAALLTKALWRKPGLLGFYEATLNDWQKIVDKDDPKNKKGALEAVFAVKWMPRLANVDEENLDEMRRVIGELEEWKKKYRFQDDNRAALLHARAAIRLAAADQNSAGEEQLDQAKDYEPDDLFVRFMLAQAMGAVHGYGGGTGTGFAVAAGGYILTNHHVTEGGSKHMVRLADREDPVPAKVLAEDTERDMALLKIELPDGLELKPLPIAAAEVSRGARIGVYGFPGGEEMGKGLKFTSGFVSDEPDQNDEKMYLLDCRVNPGNSGGPLCNDRGEVVGMVTLKVGGLGMDSYGMALPAKDLRAFLEKHHPESEKLPPPETDPERLEWDKISRIVGPSVVMIMTSK